MRAFILGGGQGSRTMNPQLPKVLTKVSGMALLDLQLNELLAIDEVSRITLLLGHEADQVIANLNACLSNYSTGKTVDYVIENISLGSAGMLCQVLSELKNELCFVTLGDILPRGGITESFHLWRTDGAKQENIIFVHPNNHPNDSDSVDRSSKTGLVNTIISSRDKTSLPKPNLSPVGFFFLKSSDVQFWPDSKKMDLVQDVLPSLLRAKIEILTQDLLRRSVDVGTPERLARLQEVLASVKMILNWVVFIDRDDTLIHDPTNPASKSDAVSLTLGVIPLLKFLNAAGIPVVCISNQPSIAKGQSTFQKIDTQNQEIQDLLAGENVYVDKWLYCPHHPETGFEGEIKELKISCDCRKPRPGMIAEVEVQHNIDVTNSVIIGDTFRDVEIEANLALRIHFLPSGACDILTDHVCVRNLDQAKDQLAIFLGGSADNDHR
jgi:mannose-1-phosphate guanylyltransferase/phosphomannomutase